MDVETPEQAAPSGRHHALLEGGPADIPQDQRERPVEGGQYKIKVPHRGGYEHFERTEEYSGGAEGGDRRIYRWVGRTRIAE